MKINSKIRKFRLPAILLFTLVMSLFPLRVELNAQDTSSLGLSVSPQIFELDVFPGEIVTDKIFLKNTSQAPLPILIRTADFYADDETGEMQFSESLQDSVLASRKWFETQKKNFILDTGDREQVDFAIKVPENAEPGGYYSVMLFEPQLPDFYFKPGQPKAIPVIGVLFLISVKNLSLDEQGQPDPIVISDFQIPEEKKMQKLGIFLADMISFASKAKAEINIVENKPTSFLLRVKNNDIYHHKVSGRIMIYNFLGNAVGESEIKKTTILPGMSRWFEVQVSAEEPQILKFLPASVSDFIAKNTSLGKYSAVLEISGDENDAKISRIISFWSFPWKTALTLFFVLIIFVIIRKRLYAALKVLAKRQ